MTPFIQGVIFFGHNSQFLTYFSQKNVIFLNLVRKNSEHVAYISSAGNTMV